MPLSPRSYDEHVAELYTAYLNGTGPLPSIKRDQSPSNSELHLGKLTNSSSAAGPWTGIEAHQGTGKRSADVVCNENHSPSSRYPEPLTSCQSLRHRNDMRDGQINACPKLRSKCSNGFTESKTANNTRNYIQFSTDSTSESELRQYQTKVLSSLLAKADLNEGDCEDVVEVVNLSTDETPSTQPPRRKQRIEKLRSVLEPTSKESEKAVLNQDRAKNNIHSRQSPMIMTADIPEKSHVDKTADLLREKAIDALRENRNIRALNMYNIAVDLIGTLQGSEGRFLAQLLVEKGAVLKLMGKKEGSNDCYEFAEFLGMSLAESVYHAMQIKNVAKVAYDHEEI